MTGAERLQSRLIEFRQRGETGVVPFISAGDPSLAVSREILLGLDRAGAAAIEIGVPFSDPIADGPVIQVASQRALDGGASLAGIFDLLESVRDELDAPLVLFSYLNPILAFGIERFLERARQSNVAGLLLTDAVPGAAPELETALRDAGIARIVLVAPTTGEQRLAHLMSYAEGFVYVIARRGVTGVGREEDEAPRAIERLRKLTDVPLYVGFGVRERSDVERIGAYADGVIVGSALVQHLHEVDDHGARGEAAETMLSSLRGTTPAGS